MQALFSKTIAVIRSAAVILLLTVVLAIVVELGARLLLVLKEGRGTIDDRIHADAYGDAAWLEDYYRELEASGRVAWKPYVYWRREPFKGEYINIDARGVRRTLPASPLAEEAVEVYFLGGSTMWGTGVRDNYTVPSLVARECVGDGIGNVAITNWGETGYVSTQEVILLALLLKRVFARTLSSSTTV